MSNQDFDRAVNFLQGALNAATSAVAADEQTKADATEKSETQPSQGTGPLLPGFEPPKVDISFGPASAPSDQAVAADDDTHDTPPTKAGLPPLPDILTAPQGTPAPVLHHKAEKSPLELHPPAQKRASLAAQAAQSAQNAEPKKPAGRLNATAALVALSGVLFICLVIACTCLYNSGEKSMAANEPEIPFALLPDSADPELWDIVTTMSGEIDGVALQFERGIATGNGITYKLQLDFCRNGSDIYAKVTGDKTYVVRLDETGRINKSYPAPKNRKPLKEIFGK